MNLAIIQARLSSSRLPNKVLLKFDKKMLIEVIYQRVIKSKLVDKCIFAIPNNKNNDLLALELNKKNITFARGSEDDVLSRFLYASKIYKPKNIIRITSDCPLIDPNIIDSVIKMHTSYGYDYTSNICPPSFPDGLDVEIIKTDILRDLKDVSLSPFHKEHVTSFIRNNPHLYNIGNLQCKINYSNLRLTIDYLQDYKLIDNILFLNKYDFGISFENIIQTLNNDNNLINLNSHYSRMNINEEK